MFDQFIHEALLGSRALRNRYTIMRHGRALSNIEGRLRGDPALIQTGYGLVDEAHAPIAEAAARWLADGITLPGVIVSSDARRTIETAVLMRDGLGIAISVQLEPRLRERYWGLYEGTEENNCFHVYADDRRDLAHNPHQAETVESMARRLVSLVVDLETNHSGQHILLVSHCDPIQIMQGIFTGADVKHYIQMPQFSCAEFRLLEFLPRLQSGGKIKPAIAGSIDRLIAENTPRVNPALRGCEPVSP